MIAYFLFQLCGLIDGYFARQELPSQYTAHNITITLRTVVRGLAYLVTFLFGANAVGLAGKNTPRKYRQCQSFPWSLGKHRTSGVL